MKTYYYEKYTQAKHITQDKILEGNQVLAAFNLGRACAYLDESFKNEEMSSKAFIQWLNITDELQQMIAAMK